MKPLAPAHQLVAALALAPLLGGCMTSSIERRTVASPAQLRLVRGDAPSLSGAFQHVPGAIVGQVSLTRACKQEETQEMRTQAYEVVKPNRQAGFGAFLLGAATAVLGLAVVGSAGDGQNADYHSCTGPADDRCKSPRELKTEGGVTLLVLGAATMAAGVMVLKTKPSEHEAGKAEVEKQTRTVDAEASCGSPELVEGLTLSASLPDGTMTAGSVDAAGSVRLPLPRELPQGQGPLPVYVTLVPERLRELVAPGAQVGEVTLAAMKAPAARRPARGKAR